MSFKLFSCDYDYLNIYDGNSNSAKLIGKFCGGNDVEVVSSDRNLYLEFHSDDSNEFTGFRFKYSFQQASGNPSLSSYRDIFHFIEIIILYIIFIPTKFEKATLKWRQFPFQMKH